MQKKRTEKQNSQQRLLRIKIYKMLHYIKRNFDPPVNDIIDFLFDKLVSPEDLSDSNCNQRALLPILDDDKQIPIQASVLVLTRTNSKTEKDTSSSIDEETEECCTESASQ